MEEYTPESQESKSEDLKRWFQDNLRIVISIAIVVIIAGGIYSYSKRSEVNTAAEDKISQESQATETAANDKGSATDGQSKSAVTTAASSKETETSFVETAGKGNGLTVLARSAAANYLEKNPDSTLTKEHKIFIEDYLRKSVNHKGGVRVGSSVEFSKELIQKAIDQSKKLNERQLKNLQKYSARVSNL